MRGLEYLEGTSIEGSRSGEGGDCWVVVGGVVEIQSSDTWIVTAVVVVDVEQRKKKQSLGLKVRDEYISSIQASRLNRARHYFDRSSTYRMQETCPVHALHGCEVQDL